MQKSLIFLEQVLPNLTIVGIGAGFSGSFQARQSRLKPFFAWVATKVKG